MSATDQGLKLFKGSVSHHRRVPVEHAFRYSIFQIWLDTERTSLINKISPWWSDQKANLVRFKRSNYLPGELSLHAQVCELVHQKTGKPFTGKAYLLASLSYWGYCYNPVSFICCYENDELQYVITEIHNTPWGERFCYIHDIKATESANQASSRPALQRHSFDKAFHVSPFMPMNMQYEWLYHIEGNKFMFSMNLLDDGNSIFNATLNLVGQPLTRMQANLLPFRYPLMCFKVLGAIYWNAFLLWLKRVPFHAHPDSKNMTSNETSPS